MAELADQETLIGAPLDCEGETLVAAPLVDQEELRAALIDVQGLAGPPGPPGADGADGADGASVGVAELVLPGGAVVLVPVLPIIAVAQGATTPSPGAGVRAMAWSSVLSALVIWTGVSWQQVTGGAATDPNAVVNDQGVGLFNDQGEELVIDDTIIIEPPDPLSVGNLQGETLQNIQGEVILAG